MGHSMSTRLGKGSILKKTIGFGSSTLLSRFLGIFREMVMTWYFGASGTLDAFLTAYKIPNSLRKIFAEGALSVALIPTLVSMKHKGATHQINRLMTLSFIVFEGILIALCILMVWQVDWLFRIVVPGWYIGGESSTIFGIPVPAAWLGLGEPNEQVLLGITLFRILISFIVFLSSSSILAAALQSINHFFVPAIAPVLLNLVFITGLLVGWYYNLPPQYLCFFILLGGLLQFLLHVVVYFKFNFGFSRADSETWRYFKTVFRKFLPCLFSMSVMEISLFVDTSFASYLPTGSVALINLANRFMGIPLGVFAAAFSTILL